MAIQVIQLNCTEGYYYGLVLNSKGDSTNCRSFEAARHFYVSNSYFARNTIGAVLNLITYSACVKLENITVEHQNNASLKIISNHSSAIIMENININHNRGAMRIISTNLETPLFEFMDPVLLLIIIIKLCVCITAMSHFMAISHSSKTKVDMEVQLMHRTLRYTFKEL